MKRFAKSILGVTLLEIMLVLAIAAMIIVMSVRYYQSATVNQQANAFISQLQAMAAAADSLAQASGSYTGITSTSIISITGGTMKAPWGGTITITAAATSMTFAVSPVPTTAVCTLVRTRLATNTHWSGSAGSSTAIGATCASIVYNSNT